MSHVVMLSGVRGEGGATTEYELIGSPTRYKELAIRRSVFRCDPTTVNIAAMGRGRWDGWGTNFNRHLAAQAALGEMVERCSSSPDRPAICADNTLAGYSLSRGESVCVPAGRVYYGQRSRSCGVDGHLQHCDSSGAASQVNSWPAIEAAWLEFFERQCFVYSWLTRTPGRVVYHTTPAKSQRRDLTEYFDEVFVIDISLHPAVCVALVLGFGQRFIGIGLGSHWRTTRAIDAAFREMFGQVSYYAPWLLGRRADLRQHTEYVITDVYARNVYENYTPLTFKKAMDYLVQGQSRNHSNVSAGNGSLQTVLEVCRAIHVDPIVVLVPGNFPNLPHRVVRVTADGGYPSMRCDLFQPEDFAISHHNGATSFPNRGVLVPFP